MSMSFAPENVAVGISDLYEIGINSEPPLSSPVFIKIVCHSLIS